LALPQSPRLLEQTLKDKIYDAAVGMAEDALSMARFVISWLEDWPQGLIGLVVLIRYSNWKSFASIGFATFSIGISIIKGVGIPLGRYVFFYELQRNERELAQKVLEVWLQKQEVTVDEIWMQQKPDAEKTLDPWLNTRFQAFRPVREYASEALETGVLRSVHVLFVGTVSLQERATMMQASLERQGCCQMLLEAPKFDELENIIEKERKFYSPKNDLSVTFRAHAEEFELRVRPHSDKSPAWWINFEDAKKKAIKGTKKEKAAEQHAKKRAKAGPSRFFRPSYFLSAEADDD